MKRIFFVALPNRDLLGRTALRAAVEYFRKKKDYSILTFIPSNSNTLQQDGYFFFPMPFGRQILYKILLSCYLLYSVLLKKVDIIVCDYLTVGVLKPIVLFRRIIGSPVKLAVDIRTVPVANIKKANKAFYTYLRFAKQHFDGLSFITEELKKELIPASDGYNKQTVCYSSGVDLKLFSPGRFSDDELIQFKRDLGLENKFIVFYHGVISEKRGIEELVDAFKQVGGNTHFLCVGYGKLFNKIKDKIARNALTNISLFEAQPYEAIPKYISIADVCIVPLDDRKRWRVSSPLKLYEYLAMAKPMILTRIIPHREVIEKCPNNFVIDNIHPETIANAIADAQQSHDLRERVSLENLDYALENCSWEAQLKKFEYFLSSL